MYDPERPTSQFISINLNSAQSNLCELTIRLPWEVAEQLFLALSENFDAREIRERQDAEYQKAQAKVRADRKRESAEIGKSIQTAVELARADGLANDAAWRTVAGSHGLSVQMAKLHAGQHRNLKDQKRNKRICALALDGNSNAEIAKKVGVAPETVQRILSNARRKPGSIIPPLYSKKPRASSQRTDKRTGKAGE
jgi:DNA-binding NarL/FixJ family response regulator